VRTEAYAKINLSLEVLAGREDGFHQVATVLQTVDLADILYFEPAIGLTVGCSIPELSGERNLVLAAARALQELSGWRSGVKIYIDKYIPVAMGLGGGSSDAAATLVSLNRYWRLGLSTGELEAIGRGLGSDVPFFIRGGTALGEGRGDVLKTLKPLGQQWLVLVCQPSQLADKTSLLYSKLERNDYTSGLVSHILAEAIDRGSFAHNMLFNVFEQVALRTYDELSQVMDDMIWAGADSVQLSGTGPALYTLVPDRYQGCSIRDQLMKKGHSTYLLQTIGVSPDLTLTLGSN